MFLAFLQMLQDTIGSDTFSLLVEKRVVDQESQRLINIGHSPNFSNICENVSDTISVKSLFQTNPGDLLAITSFLMKG